jgi:hypothetical protein
MAGFLQAMHPSVMRGFDMLVRLYQTAGLAIIALGAILAVDLVCQGWSFTVLGLAIKAPH